MINMLVLFAQFSKKAYGAKPSSTAGEKQAALPHKESEGELNCPANLAKVD